MKTKHQLILPLTKSSRRKFATHRMWFGAASGFFVGIVLLTLSPQLVRAGCSNWDVGGTWEIKQNNGASITVVVVQKGSGFNVTSPTGGGGSGSGNISGNDFFMEIGWYGGSHDGVYSGKIRSSGRIEGTAYDAGNHPEIKVTWFSASTMKCADAAPVQPTPKVIKSSGKAKPATTPTQLPVYPGSGSSGSGTKGGFIQLHTPTPSAEADESSSTDTKDQQKKKKKKNKKKHHHHDDDDQNQDND